MAPLSTHLVHAIYKGSFYTRGLSDDLSQNLSVSQQTTLQCLALAFSIVSVVSAILAFYWFVKMRRSFRHE
jgi:G protein-coupled receptor GPR1